MMPGTTRHSLPGRRTLLLVPLLLGAGCAGVPRGAAAPQALAQYGAVVDGDYRGEADASAGGVPVHSTIGGALAAAPAEGGRPHVIFIRDGRYHEKLTVDKPDIHLVGESRDGTVLTYDAAAGQARPEGGTWGTRGSFTLRVTAPRFRLRNLTVENAFDYPAEAAKAVDDPTRLSGLQAVALLLETGSDQAVISDCRLSGYQDTVFADAGRAYFHRCEILGHVDLIFGAGQAVFDDCDIVSRDRGSATNNGYIAAPSTLKSQPYGFLVVASRLRKEHPALAAGSVSLGRPWRPSGDPQAAGSAVYVDVHMEDHVSERGWEPMGGFPPEDARLFEYGSRGPGAHFGPSRRVLSEAEAAYFTVPQVLRGWDPRAD